MDDDRTRTEEADEALLGQLRAAAREHDPIPQEALLAARSALAYRALDAELAALTADSDALTPELAGVRSDLDAGRLLTFQSGAHELELEVVVAGERRRLVGQCVPAGALELTIEHRDGRDTVATDDLGRFETEVSAGPLRLRCSWPLAQHEVRTDWVTV